MKRDRQAIIACAKLAQVQQPRRTIMEARGSGYGGASRSKTGGKHLPLESRAAADAPFRAEWRTPGEMGAEGSAWRSLAARALEPNVFAEPEFLGAVLKHGVDARRVALLAVWQGPVLRGLFPLLSPRLPFGPGEARLWRPDLAASGPPLVDRGDPEAVLEAMLGFLAQLGPSHATLTLPRLAADGPLATALRAFGERTGRRVEPSNPSEQAVLRADAPGADARRSGPSGSVRAENGIVYRIESAREPHDIRDAVEEFLTMEARSAQASSVPALIEQPGAALLVRTLTRELARSRRCRVDLLRNGERAVAGAIVLRSGDRAWLWRIVGEEGADGRRPAHVLASAIAQAQTRRHTVASTLSCLPLHASVTAGIWRGRETVADLSIATRPGARANAATLGRALKSTLRGFAGLRDRAA